MQVDATRIHLNRNKLSWSLWPWPPAAPFSIEVKLHHMRPFEGHETRRFDVLTEAPGQSQDKGKKSIMTSKSLGPPHSSFKTVWISFPLPWLYPVATANPNLLILQPASAASAPPMSYTWMSEVLSQQNAPRWLQSHPWLLRRGPTRFLNRCRKVGCNLEMVSISVQSQSQQHSLCHSQHGWCQGELGFAFAIYLCCCKPTCLGCLHKTSGSRPCRGI
jgi:hypothetical protein